MAYHQIRTFNITTESGFLHRLPLGTIDEKLKGPYLGLRKKVEEMTVQDIRTEIDQILATLSSEELKLVLSLLKQFKGNSPKNLELALNLGRIIQEDGEVLKKLAE